VARLPHPVARRGEQGVDGIVAPRRVVMEERQSSHRSGDRQVDGVVRGTVAPPDLCGVLGRGVVGVVDDEIRPAKKLGMARVAGMQEALGLE
jgi:hypothetical protein